MSLISIMRDIPQKKGSIRPTTHGGGAVPAAVQSGSDKAWEALTKFIPTEVLAPYAAGLSLAQSQLWDATNVYVAFIVITPVAAVLFYLAKVALSNEPWPPAGPLVWRALAAMLAFAVWGLSVPTNPVQASIGGAAVAGFVAITVSPVLAAVEAIVLRMMRD